jgi:hypothetical protein
VNRSTKAATAAIAVLLTAGCPNDAEDFIPGPVDPVLVDGTPRTVDDGEGGEAECGGPPPYAGADALPDTADILSMTATQTAESLTVEATFAGDAEAASKSFGNAYTVVASTTEGKLLDVLQKGEMQANEWKVVDGLASVEGGWTSPKDIRIILTAFDGAAEWVNISTYGRTDGASWCDTARIDFVDE